MTDGPRGTSPVTLPRLLRGLAIVIVVLALLDPALPSGRHADPIVAVVDAGEAGIGHASIGGAGADERPWVERVADRLDDRFTVVRGPYPGASATVLAGDHLPAALSAGTLVLGPPVFLAHPHGAGLSPGPRIVHVEAPRRVSPETTIPVRAWIVPGAEPAGLLRASLLVDGAVLSDTVFTAPEPAAAPAVITFEFIPTRGGPVSLRVEVIEEGRPGAPVPAARADVLVDENLRRWNVLFFDGRPSWMSTFVRRAIEPDPRFAVTSRTLTSPGLATEFGAPPVSLAAGGLDDFDAVVVGAPELLSNSDVDALHAFMEMRGGSVLLLLDREASGTHDRLTGVTAWTRGGAAEPVVLTPAAEGYGDGALRTLESRSMIWPNPMPPGARALATTPAGDPVLWRRPVGKGRLIVSGALDNWQFRDPETTAFEPVWRSIVGEAADLAPGLLEAEWVGADRGGGAGHGAGSGISMPGGLLHFQVTLRESPAPGTPVRAVAHLRGPGADGERLPMVPLWPTEFPGRFEGRFHAPAGTGDHELVVRVEGGGVPDDAATGGASPGGASPGGASTWQHGATLPFRILADAAPPPPDDPALLAAWAASRGGTLRGSDELDLLEAEILRAIGAEGPSDPWHPMRSPWWILPLALLLGGEWAWRRRRGLP